MTTSRPASATIHRTRMRRGRVVVLVAVAAVVGVLCDQLLASTTPSGGTVPTAQEIQTAGPSIDAADVPDAPADPVALPEPVALPGSDGLDPALLAALTSAAADAAGDGVGLRIDSGRRTPEHQQELLDEAIAKYGSAQEAARWVAPPDRSAHVSGDAVDVGPTDAAAWLSAHGAAYGLCQIYANEPWHYELRPDAADDGCPRMYPDPTHDPRLHQ